VAKKKTTHYSWKKYKTLLIGLATLVVFTIFAYNQLQLNKNQIFEIGRPSIIVDCVPLPACVNSTTAPCLLDGSTNWCPLGSPSPTPLPSGCHYSRVQCIQAPCDPEIVCSTGSTQPIYVSSPVPATTSVPTSAGSPQCQIYYPPCQQRICASGENCVQPDCSPITVCSSPTPSSSPVPVIPNRSRLMQIINNIFSR
jgi:hypothetical protein